MKLGDKGAIHLAKAVAINSSIRELSLSRCGITDGGGRVLMEALAENKRISHLDVSWNTMRGDSARAIAGCMRQNKAIRVLNLSYNGFYDIDGARILQVPPLTALCTTTHCTAMPCPVLIQPLSLPSTIHKHPPPLLLCPTLSCSACGLRGCVPWIHSWP